MGKIRTSNAAGIGSYVIVINKDDMKIKGDQSEIKKRIRGSIDNAEQIYIGVQKNGSFEKLESANVDLSDGELKLITESYILNFEAEEIEIEDNPGGGGGGGTSDYSKLTNKPTIDGVELRKGATHSELGLLGTVDKEDLENSIAGKQDRLTAGENITINGTVISATGGGGSVEPGDENGTVLTTVVNYAENPVITPQEMAASNTLYFNLAALAAVAERPDWVYFQLMRNQSGMPWDLYTQDIEYDTNKQSKSIIWSSGIDTDQSLFLMKQHYLDPELGDTVKEYRLYTNLSDYPQDYNEEYQTWPGFPEQLPVGKTLLATHVKGETDEMLFSDLYDNTEIIYLSMLSFTNDSGQEITIPEIWNGLTHHVSVSPIALPEKTVEWKYPEAHIKEVSDFGSFENESGIFTGDSFAQASAEDASTCVNILSSGTLTPSDGSSSFRGGTAQIMVESFLDEEEGIISQIDLSVSGGTELYIEKSGAHLFMDTYPARENEDPDLLVTKDYVDRCVPSFAPEGDSVLVNHRQNAIKHLRESYTEEEFIDFLDGKEMKNVRCWYMEGGDSKFVGFGVSDLAGVHGFLYECVNDITDEDTSYAYLPVDMGSFTPGWYLVHDLYNYDVEPIDYVPDFYCPTGGDDVNFEFEGVDSLEEFDVLLDIEQYFEQWTEWEPKEENVPTTITFKANSWSWPTDVDSKMVYDHTKKALQEYQQSGSTLNLSLPIYRVFDDSSMTFDNEYSVSVSYIEFQEGEEGSEDPQIRFAFYRGEDKVASRYLLSDGNFTELL